MSTPYPWIKVSQYGTTPSKPDYLEVTSPNGLYLNSANSEVLLSNPTTSNEVQFTPTNLTYTPNGGVSSTATWPSIISSVTTPQVIYASSSSYSLSEGIDNQQLTIINDLTPVAPDYKQLGASGTNGTVNAIVTDNAVNTSLYLGGDFTTVNGTQVNLVAKVNIDGTVTDDLNGGISPGTVKCLSYLSTNSSLYAGGIFTSAADSLGPTLNNIGYYNGAWKSMGSGAQPGLGGQVNAIESNTFSTYLHCGGEFTTDSNGNDMPYITRYHKDYNVFEPLQDPDITPYGVNGQVKTIDVDTNGYIYVGGSFTIAGEKNATNVARYNLESKIWEALSGVKTINNGINLIENVGEGAHGGGVYAVYWASNINRLYVAGNFSYVQSSQIIATNVAYWTPGPGGLGTWNTLTDERNGNEGLTGEVHTIAYDDTSKVYFGGLFSNADQLQVNNVAYWNQDKSSWNVLAGNGGVGTNGKVLTMVWSNSLPDIGAGLFVGGEFQTVDNGIEVNYVALWAPVGTGIWYGLYVGGSPPAFTTPGVDSYVNALAWDNTNTLYIGGSFQNVNYYDGGNASTYNYPWMVTWKVSSIYNSVASGNWDNAVTSMSATVHSLHYNGSGVYAGGDFITAGGTTVNYAAYWNGSTWSKIANGLNSPVHSIKYYSPFVFCGGTFTLANESNVSNSNIRTKFIAYTDNSSWYPLMETVLPYGIKTANISTEKIYAVAYDSNLNRIYVGGDFKNAGGIYANNIAMYDVGSNIWYPFIQSSTQINGVDNIVRALYFDGSYLYVGGDFTYAGGIQVNYIAKWTGSWSILNDLSTGGFGTDGPVYCITHYYQVVYIGGAFSAVGGSVTATNVASWDSNNSLWGALSSGSSGNQGVNGRVYAILHSYGSFFGEAVIIGGSFDSAANGTSASNVVAWGNHYGSYEYYPLYDQYQSNQGTNGPVYALARSTYDPSILYVGGSFSAVGGQGTTNIASWKWAGYLANFGTWASLGDNSINGIVRTLVCDNNYNLYVGGEFTEAKIDGSSTTTVNNLVVYLESNEKYNTLPTASSTSTTIKGSGANGTLGYVHSLCYNSGNTYLIVGGEFQYVYNSSQPSLKTKNIAIIDTSSSTWIKTPSPIPKLNEKVFAIKYYTTDIFVGGHFTGLSSNQQPLKYIARWNIADNLWYPIVENNPIPQNDMNGVDYDVYSFAFEGTTTNLYVGGEFATGGGKTLNNIAKLVNATSLTPYWVPLPDALLPMYGVRSTVRSIYFSGDNAYICGDFMQSGSTVNPTTSLLHVAKINSSNQIVQIKNSSGTHIGMNNTVYSNVYVHPNIYFGGAFTNTAPTSDLPMNNISYFSTNTVVTPLTITTTTDGFLDTESGTTYDKITIPTRYKLTNLIYNSSLDVWLEAYRSTGVTTTN